MIYTIDPPTVNETELRKDAERRFDLTIPKPIRLVHLHEYKDLLVPSPFLSLVIESIGTMRLAYQAMKRHTPDVFCDTTGCAFTFLIARWMHPQAQLFAYVHYPTISTDMMAYEWHNTARSKLKTTIKLIYYWCFAILYGLVGSMADLTMVNSTWTYNHIKSLWRWAKKVDIVYPPCRVDIEDKLSNGDDGDDDNRIPTRIVSIAQFRPEKNHRLQIEAVALLLKKSSSASKIQMVDLLVIGSCRNPDDEQRVQELKALTKDLGIDSKVHFSINPPYEDLMKSMKSSSIGLHTMRQEHFGIGIVEMMAAGLLVVAHNSGGPKEDIVQDRETGFLATAAEEYAAAIEECLEMTDSEANEMRRNAKKSALRFSDEAFDRSFTKSFAGYLIS